MKLVQYATLTIFIALSGCFEVLGNKSCVNKTCSSALNYFEEINWEPKVFENKECQRLTGTYKNTGRLSSNNTSPDYIGIFLHLSDYVFFETNQEFEVRNEIHLPIPSKSLTIKYRALNGTQLGEGVRHDYSEFYSSALISILMDNEHMKIDLLDSKKSKYKSVITTFNPTNIGCVGKRVYIRRINVVNGVEGSIGSITAKELIFEKTDEGNLQLTKQERYWQYSNSIGLLNVKSPKVNKFTLIFEPLKVNGSD